MPNPRSRIPTSQKAMGGIIGKLSFDSAEILGRAVLDGMLDASARRGSEIRDVFTAPGIALGWSGFRDHRAPALVDAHIGASDARNVRAVADSQLTNAGELRDALERGGHRFCTRTDEELIAHAYDRWGTRAFERLRGPFACAVWDETNRRLVLARDHVGIRGLYFAVLHGHGVVFASDVRALLQDPGVAREWCPDGIDSYFALGYIPSPLTAYRQVSKLQPAHYLLVEGRRLHLEEFWDPPAPSRTTTRRGSMTAIAEGLASAVRKESNGQQHEAVLYSGGAASCALLSVTQAASEIAITVHTDQDPAELARSGAAAAALGCTHELETLAHPVASLVETLAAASGEPFADPFAVTQLAICDAAARHADAAIAGHGAAILWGGCDRTALSRFAPPCRNEHVATHAHTVWEDQQRRSIYTRAFAWKVRDSNPFNWHLERWRSRGTDAPRDRALYVNARTLLPDNILAMAAIASQGAKLPLGFPFLEHQMVELAMQTPMSIKARRRHAMSLLRQLLGPRLPRRLKPPALRRPPRHPWLAAALTTFVPKVLLGPRFDGRDIVSRPALFRLWNEHQTARADHSRRLWSLLMLEFWFREFIDGDAATEPLEYAVLLKAA
jgi:asparagine synthase (glutamine-hydrolysing)